MESIEGLETTILTAPNPFSNVVRFNGGQGVPFPVIRGFSISGSGSSTSVFVPMWHSGAVENCVIHGHGNGAYNWFDMFFVNCTIVDNVNGLDTGPGAGHGSPEHLY